MKWRYDNVPWIYAYLNGKRVPFAGHGRASTSTRDYLRRGKAIRRFIGGDIAKLNTLDIGEPNNLGTYLEVKDNTLAFDWNLCGIVAPGANYDLILNSEAIEHTMNPGAMMADCYRLLKPGGICIVATPLYRWHSGITHRSPHHFAEYQPARLNELFQYVGFEVVKFGVIPLWDCRFAFYGIRPILRLLFHRSQIWMLRRPV